MTQSVVNLGITNAMTNPKLLTGSCFINAEGTAKVLKAQTAWQNHRIGCAERSRSWSLPVLSDRPLSGWRGQPDGVIR